MSFFRAHLYFLSFLISSNCICLKHCWCRLRSQKCAHLLSTDRGVGDLCCLQRVALITRWRAKTNGGLGGGALLRTSRPPLLMITPKSSVTERTWAGLRWRVSQDLFWAAFESHLTGILNKNTHLCTINSLSLSIWTARALSRVNNHYQEKDMPSI